MEELKKFGKEDWAQPRKDVVTAKGKGELRTFWLNSAGCDTNDARSSVGDNTSVSGDSTDANSTIDDMNDGDKPESAPYVELPSLSRANLRLAKWMVDVLSKFLKQSKARREATQSPVLSNAEREELELLEQKSVIGGIGSHPVVNEVKDTIKFNDQKVAGNEMSYVELATEVVTELREYVHTVASMYSDNVRTQKNRLCSLLETRTAH